MSTFLPDFIEKRSFSGFNTGITQRNIPSDGQKVLQVDQTADLSKKYLVEAADFFLTEPGVYDSFSASE